MIEKTIMSHTVFCW